MCIRSEKITNNIWVWLKNVKLTKGWNIYTIHVLKLSTVHAQKVTTLVRFYFKS